MSALEDAITNDHDMKDLFAHETNTPTLVKVEDLPSHLQIKRARFIIELDGDATDGDTTTDRDGDVTDGDTTDCDRDGDATDGDTTDCDRDGDATDGDTTTDRDRDATDGDTMDNVLFNEIE